MNLGLVLGCFAASLFYVVKGECKDELRRCFQAHSYFFNVRYNEVPKTEEVGILGDFCIAWQGLLDCYANTRSCQMGVESDMRLSASWQMGHIFFYRVGVAIKTGVCPNLDLTSIYGGILAPHRKMSLVIPEDFYAMDNAMVCFQRNMQEAAVEYALIMEMKSDFCIASEEAANFLKLHEFPECDAVSPLAIRNLIEAPAKDFPRLVNLVKSRTPMNSGIGVC
ncbi:unnamed protein product [Owenia fusiformis]|uniref:Uncharacterized protein n=1 Tax=Owenia fusiformis TaxID=6347 RepID=A0A8J1U056_OWEFU|nr:unnamed protein product [Owenia fusiformis]CAH1786648.1 unnamed protein product [Owenia fusiformis]